MFKQILNALPVRSFSSIITLAALDASAEVAADPGRSFTGIEPLEPRILLSDVAILNAASAIADLEASGLSSVYTRQVEDLDRGVVAIRTGTSRAYISWRMLGLDPTDIGFNLYRQTNGGSPVRINNGLITQTTDFIDTNANQANDITYFVRPVIDRAEGPDSPSFTLEANGGIKPHLTVPIQPPPASTMPDGTEYTYSANDASVGDLDGDGDYEIILKWEPSNSGDNNSGYRANVFIDAYDLDGTQLWRLNLGKNIRAGAHYTQFQVYDYDGDGRAEVALRTAPGTIDGQGNAVLLPGDAVTDDYRNSGGYILDGPEYLTVFDGYTGAELDTVAFEPERGHVSEWGDGYGNRVDRHNSATAYLDGVHPSIIMSRGYYGPQSGYSARNEIAAYDFQNGEITLRWLWESSTNGPNADYIGQGNHQLSIADVDGDGYDEIIRGASIIDHDGTGYLNTGAGHGDALHVSDMDPTNPGLEIFLPQESPTEYQNLPGGNAGGHLYDADTGELLLGIPSNGDVGRGVAMDIDPNHLGYEMWATTSDPDGGPRYIYNVDGTALYETPSNMFYNFGVWWDADPLRELLDRTTISKWHSPGRSNFDLDPNSSSFYPVDASSNNGTKSTPALSGDILGDWREEVIWRNTSSTELHIYTTTIPANSRMVTLMHDTQYRSAIAWQNSSYNQPPHPSFYLGAGMQDPPTPNVSYATFTDELPIPDTDTTYPAEHAIYGGGTTNAENNNPGFNDDGFINFNTSGGFVLFENVWAASGGTTQLTIRYALGNTDRTGNLIVNGAAQPITFASTDGWTNYQTMTVAVDLNPGFDNTIRFESTGQDLANIDEIQVTPNISSDINGDGAITPEDIDAIRAGIGTANPALDLDGSGAVDENDVTHYVTIQLGTFMGDANLDFAVDLLDLSALASNFGNVYVGWGGGDFNGDGTVNLLDLSILASNFGNTTMQTPSPRSLTLQTEAGQGQTLEQQQEQATQTPAAEDQASTTWYRTRAGDINASRRIQQTQQQQTQPQQLRQTLQPKFDTLTTRTSPLSDDLLKDADDDGFGLWS